jgi:two-component system sensor histidine kinase/response regulator
MKKNRVLLVDDYEGNVKIPQRVLEENYEIKIASDGEEAIEITKSWNPSLILLDVMMPGVGGFETCRRIRKLDVDPYVKIVFVTSKKDSKDKQEGYDAGADDYMVRPYDLREMRSKAKVLIDLYNSQHKIKKKAKQLEKEVQQKSVQLLEKKMIAAIGKRTAEIVYDLKLPIQNFVDVLEEIKTQGYSEDSFRSLEMIKDDLENVILSFLDERNGVALNREFDLLPVVERASQTIAVFGNLKINIDCSGEAFLLRGNKAHFLQVFSYLFKNSYESKKEDTSLEIEIILDRIDDSEGRISFKDNGESMSKVFDPVYTYANESSEVSRTKGLGLASCRRMIESYGGTIRYADVDEGNEILIELPCNFDI